MLLHHQSHLRQVMNLSAFLDLPDDPFQRLLAMLTALGPMTHYLIGGSYLHQAVPTMRLSALPSASRLDGADSDAFVWVHHSTAA